MASVWERVSEAKPRMILEDIPNGTRAYGLEEIESMVNALAAKLVKGQIVATAFPISLEVIVVMMAVWKAGAVVMPLNPALTLSEISYFLAQNVDLVLVDNPEERAVVVDAARTLGIPVSTLDASETQSVDGLRSSINSEIDYSLDGKTRDGEVGLILFTSGTTGLPKAVPLTQANLLASVDNILATLPLTSEDRTICVMPLFHIHGIVACVLTTLCSGGTLVIPSCGKFSASRFFSAIQETGCTWFTAVPTIHQILLLQPTQMAFPGKLRFIRSSSSKLDPIVLSKMESRYRCPVIEAYAMTETAYQITSNLCDWARRRPGTVGIAIGSVEIKILASEEGEIYVSGPNVTSGYLNNSDSNENSFVVIEDKRFFRTGDCGSLDPMGFLTITGRIKEQINCGGEKISPVEIDGVMKEFDGIKEAVSFGVPDELYGESVAVAVVPASASELKPELIDFAANKLAKHKIPSKWFFVDDLPRTATGKVQRTSLASFFQSH